MIRTKTLNWGKIESSFVDKSVRQRQPLVATRWPPCQGNPEKKRRERRSRKQIAASHLYCSTRISALDRTKENPFPSLLWMHVYYRFRHKNGRFMRKSGYWIFQYISAWKWHGITATTTFYYIIQRINSISTSAQDDADVTTSSIILLPRSQMCARAKTKEIPYPPMDHR